MYHSESASAYSRIINRFVMVARERGFDLRALGNQKKLHALAESLGLKNWQTMSAVFNERAFTHVLTTYYGQNRAESKKAFKAFSKEYIRKYESIEHLAHEYCFQNGYKLVGFAPLNTESEHDLKVFLNANGYVFFERIRDPEDGNVHFWMNPRIDIEYGSSRQFDSHLKVLKNALADHHQSEKKKSPDEKVDGLVFEMERLMDIVGCLDGELRQQFCLKHGSSLDQWSIEALSETINWLPAGSSFKEELEEYWNSI